MRLFIHILAGSQLVSDREGGEFADVAEAQSEAARTARELMADQLRAGNPVPLDWQARISDGSGKILAEVPFTDFARERTGEATERRAKVPPPFIELFRRATSNFEKSRAINQEISHGIADIREQLLRLSQMTSDFPRR